MSTQLYGAPSLVGVSFDQKFSGIDLENPYDYWMDGYLVHPFYPEPETPMQVEVFQHGQVVARFDETSLATAEDQAVEWIEDQLDVLSAILND